MLLTLAVPALAGPEASGRIGLSLVIPPRVSLETRTNAEAVACISEETGSGRLRVVDAEGRSLPDCGAEPKRDHDHSARRVTVIPV